MLWGVKWSIVQKMLADAPGYEPEPIEPGSGRKSSGGSKTGKSREIKLFGKENQEKLKEYFVTLESAQHNNTQQ